MFARFLQGRFSQRRSKKISRGFTLVEVLVGTAVFVVVSLAAYKAFTGLSQLVSLTQYKIAAINLLNEQIEIVRNIPYSDVGVAGGYPAGVITQTQTIARNSIQFQVDTIVRSIDLPYDGTIGGSPNDTSPADNKLIEITVSCPGCPNFNPVSLTTQVAPKNLETASTNGALFIRVSDSNGQPIPDAQVHVENNKASPTIEINDTTNVNGVLQLVDVPPGIEAYEITVTKSGYSTDRTYTTGGNGNPSPLKPHATVVLQQVTQLTFLIDKVSTMKFSSMTYTCTPVGGIDFTMVGSKLIGQGVYKYSAAHVTDGSGKLTLSPMEWDSYTVSLNDPNYDLIGFNPLNPIVVNPNSTQNISLIVATKDPKTLLVTVKNSATQLPITDALVELKDEDDEKEYKITERGYATQTDWSGGAGQLMYVEDSNMYYADDTNIENNSPAGDLKLKNVFGSYVSSGVLESSIFDTGTTSNFHSFIWSPNDQPAQTGADSVKFQLASNLTIGQNTTWNYIGPDGSNGTYYTNPFSSIFSGHDGDRYMRYKLFMSTADTSVTPNVSDISFTFTSACTPPGQVSFNDLSKVIYTLSVGKSGYATTTTSVTINSAWQQQEVLLTPN